MSEKKLYGTFIKTELIDKGWSGDKKYCVTAADGRRYLLRVSPAERFERWNDLFPILEKLNALEVPMCRLIESGVCEEGVYILQSWIDGEDLETVLPSLSETEKYVLGYKSGEILRKIHAVPAPETQEDWETRFNRKTDMKIRRYRECGLRFEGDEYVLEYIEQNRYLLKNRSQSFQHGDYHVGNMMIEKGELKIIDFDRKDFGDPWEEFNRIPLCSKLSPHFATGQLRGYFGGEPPLEFFRLLAFYIGSNMLSNIYWAVPFGQKEIDFMTTLNAEIMKSYYNMQNSVPAWYLKDFYVQYIDEIPFKLREPFDFSFLGKYGKVFKVFDDQDSGNICFGVAINDNKYFIKFAGAPAQRSRISAEEAIERMKSTVPIYRDLAHPVLIKLIDAEEIGGGFAAVFEWTDAECMGRQYPLSREKFMQMSNDTRLQMFDEILDFHVYAAKQGYVAIDFYDGCIMYDFNLNRTSLCDIEFYSKMPYNNPIGRMWGSSRFMSPEEYELGSVIDEVTNVYTMGATAFALFGDERDRCIEKWKLSKSLFDVAKRAVSDNRGERQQSVKQFIKEWGEAK